MRNQKMHAALSLLGRQQAGELETEKEIKLFSASLEHWVQMRVENTVPGALGLFK